MLTNLSYIFDYIDHLVFRLFETEWRTIMAVCILIIVELIARKIKNKLKKRIYGKYDASTDPKDSEYYLEYYKRGQIVDLFRALAFLVFLTFLLISKGGLNINFLAVAAGALIVISKDFLLSIVAFFVIVRKYEIGDTVAIGDIQWQIIYIRTFTIGIVGKDNDGDSTGKFYEIPNHKFITETLRKEDLKTESIRKELLKIPYETTKFSISIEEFLNKLSEYLDKILPIRNRKNAGNYQTYIGYKYKMDIDYLEDKCIIITVGLVGRWEDNVNHKKQIISFVESFRIKE